MEGDWSKIYVIPTEGNPWGLHVPTFREHLRAADSQTIIRHWPGMKPPAEPAHPERVDFSQPFHGELRRGMYDADEYLILDAEPPERWADFIVWFMSLLPPDARVRFNSELAVEAGMHDDNWFPRDATEAQVVQILKEHFARIPW